MPGLSPYKVTLAANGSAGDFKEINAEGSTVFVRICRVTASLEPAEILVTCRGKESGNHYSITMAGAEEWLHAEVFNQVVVQNKESQAITIEVLLGVGRFRKPVPDIVNVSVNKPSANDTESLVDFTEAGADFGQGNGNAGEVFDPADYPGFIKAWVCAHPDNSDYLRVGDENVDTDQGQVLQAGDSLVWDSLEPCNVCSEGATGDGVISATIHREV